MCRVLQVSRSTYYYEAATKKDESELTADIQEIFRKSRNHYGTRKIKKELADCGKQAKPWQRHLFLLNSGLYLQSATHYLADAIKFRYTGSNEKR